MGIEITLEEEKKILTITVSGRFDFGVHQDFRKATDQATGAVDTIIVDMGEADYVDSSALGMLLVLRDKVGDNRESVRIRNAKPDVKKILEIANFDKLFTLE